MRSAAATGPAGSRRRPNQPTHPGVKAMSNSAFKWIPVVSLVVGCLTPPRFRTVTHHAHHGHRVRRSPARRGRRLVPAGALFRGLWTFHFARQCRARAIGRTGAVDVPQRPSAVRQGLGHFPGSTDHLGATGQAAGSHTACAQLPEGPDSPDSSRDLDPLTEYSSPSTSALRDVRRHTGAGAKAAERRSVLRAHRRLVRR